MRACVAAVIAGVRASRVVVAGGLGGERVMVVRVEQVPVGEGAEPEGQVTHHQQDHQAHPGDETTSGRGRRSQGVLRACQDGVRGL